MKQTSEMHAQNHKPPTTLYLRLRSRKRPRRFCSFTQVVMLTTKIRQEPHETWTQKQGLRPYLSGRGPRRDHEFVSTALQYFNNNFKLELLRRRNGNSVEYKLTQVTQCDTFISIIPMSRETATIVSPHRPKLSQSHM